jgi:VIT1/CCC1 family predicted Fe2+/Mn2+ transporter
MSKHSILTGFSFGSTSGIITTLGLMVGLHSGTHSRSVVLGGILTIAIADAFSDALGIHVSEESENKHTLREIWISTIATFLAKFLFAMTFVIPVMLFSLNYAILVSVLWGMLLLGIFSYYLAVSQNVNPWGVIGEHLLIATVVVILTHLIGDWIGSSL